MKYGLQYLKSTFDVTKRHFLLVCILAIFIPISYYIFYRIYALIGLLYWISFGVYCTSGAYGYLCRYDNERVSLGLFHKITKKYYFQFIITGGLILLMTFLIGYALSKIMSAILPFDKVTIILIWQFLSFFIVSILTVYIMPFLFAYDAKNGTAVIYGFRYLKFILKNKRNEFLTLFILILANLTTELANRANINLIPMVLRYYISLLIFLTATNQLMSDANAKEMVSMRTGKKPNNCDK